MTNIIICRVCLSVEGRRYSIVNTPLQDIFEKISSIPLSSSEGKPLTVCHICLALLKKSHILMARTQKANQILNQLIHTGVPLSQHPWLDLSLYNLVYKYTVTQTECIDIHGNNTIKKEEEKEEEANVIGEECVNQESPGERLKETVELDEEDIGRDYETLRTDDHQSSDSEDDVPLKNLRVNQSKELKKRVRVRKKQWTQKREDKGFTADFAKEVILTKEEQAQELLERSKSLNYLNSPLKCELCYKGFIDARAYENHKRKHDEESGPFECEVCRMRYPTQRQLKTHAMTSHGRRYECTKCAHRAHTANQAREHEKWHRGHTYECKLCGHTFRKPTSYLTHMRKRHPSPHVCGACGDSFVGPHGLRMHASKAHHHSAGAAPAPAEPAAARFCADCDVQFATADAWKRHVLTSLNHSLGSDNSLQCKICDARFPLSSSLSAHVREHARALRAGRAPAAAAPPPPRAPSAACDQCGSRFINRAKLQAHIKRIHLGMRYNKNIVCEVCGKKCTSNASLKYHQRTHTGEKPYQCDTCNKRFSDSNQLRIHTRIHTGERPYSCGVCGKRFSQKPALNRHYRVHTGAKPYTCTYCSKTFSQSNSLKLHISTVHLKIPPNRRNKQINTATTEDNATIQTLN